MSDPTSQFSEQPLPPEGPSGQFSEQPMAPKPATTEVGSMPDVQRRPRMWPAYVILALQWAAVGLTSVIFHGEMAHFMTIMIAPLVSALLLLIWWLGFSRLRWTDRLLLPAVVIALAATVIFVGDKTIGGFGIVLYALPIAETACIIWLFISFPLSWPVRKAVLLAVLTVCFGYYTLVRNDGVTGEFAADIQWRWTPTEEDRFLAERQEVGAVKAAGKVEPLVIQPGDWPCFRGPNRDNRIVGVKIPTDWDKNPPKLLWKHKVGPGWGSFAVIGKHLFTQEQWGKNEAVVCYDGDTGKVIWAHEDPARFEEVVAGPGPRATPTFHDGKLYTMGAAGKLNCFDAAGGNVLWSADIMVPTGASLPQWGFSASPLVLQGQVLVFAGGDNKSVVAYDAATGKLAWTGGEAKMSYASLQRAVIDGVEQALLATGDGLTAYAPKDGKILWDYKWLLEGGARCVQAADLGNADFLLGTGFGNGTRRLHIAHDNNDQWSPSEVWSSRAINPYFNDLVIHKDHLYGFNTETFNCVTLDKGKAKWKERGYGCGQVLLLADQDLLLIISEKGEVALVEAVPTGHKELARIQAIEGKTWNHPVLAHGRLYVRNGVEAACYELAPPKK